MREHPDQPLPGLHLLLLQLRLDVVERDEAVLLLPRAEQGGEAGQLADLAVLLQAQQGFPARAQGGQGLHQAGAPRLEVGDIGEAVDPQQTLGGVVDQRHLALAVEGDEADADVLHHHLQVEGLLLLLGAGRPEGVEDLVEGALQLVEGGPEAAGDVGLREVGVADGLEKARQVAVGAVHEADQRPHLEGREHPDDQGDRRVVEVPQRQRQEHQGEAQEQDAHHHLGAEVAEHRPPAPRRIRGHTSPSSGTGRCA